MGDENDGIALRMQAIEQAMISLPVCESRLPSVRRQDDGGLIDQSAGDGDALTLSAREFVGFVVHAVSHADEVSPAFARSARFVGGNPA